MAQNRPLSDQEIAAQLADVGLWPEGSRRRHTEKADAPPAPGAGATADRDWPGLISLQGWPVLRVWRGAVYVRIPKDLQKPTGGCSCTYCVMHPNEVPSWDTLGIPIDGAGSRVTWTLHAPEWVPGEKVKP